MHVHLERPKPFGLNGRLTIDGEVSFTTPESASFVIDLDSFHGRLIAIGDTWYLEGGDTGTGDKPWIRIDPRDPAHLPGDLFGEIAGLLVVPDVAGLTTYGAEVAYVPAAASGVPGTSQYVSHLTPQAWVAGAPPARQDELDTWVEEEILSDFLTVLNIDADGLPVKQVFAAVPNSAEYTVEITYDHWGVPVHAVAPPADQVASTPGIVAA